MQRIQNDEQIEAINILKPKIEHVEHEYKISLERQREENKKRERFISVEKDQEEEISKRQKAIGHLVSSLEVKKKELERKRATSTNQMELNRLQVTLYEQILKFKIGTDESHHTTFTFTHVSRRLPEREFKFALDATYEKYTLIYCEPVIPSGKQFEKELNKDRDLILFIKKMRREFRNLATAEDIKFDLENGIAKQKGVIIEKNIITEGDLTKSIDGNAEPKPSLHDKSVLNLMKILALKRRLDDDCLKLSTNSRGQDFEKIQSTLSNLNKSDGEASKIAEEKESES
ncbi:hypothetical protein K502DRAFT_192575 [Neoconidiobolus thromboides FSU 785]|nr:hypothetical protein K502DRAFT_192575 [Neoconidiobolus thromboides FSU 785]